ncbi:MAG: GNAT family N-acetyltransferase [Kiloniellales bacterium]|nr:GNAT family N-acetyltransferase [Kiloniellales bacterium]
MDRGRVYLRPPRQRDWRLWSQVREESREFLVPWEPTWPYDALTRGSFRRRVRAYNQEMRQGSGFSFLVFRKQDDMLMGGATLSNIRRGVAQTASLGYWIGERYARQGYMTEALSAVLDFGFDHLGMHRVEAACLPHNEASRTLLMKLGFVEEGYARQFLRINGSWQDHLLFAILRNDARHQPGAVS